MKKNLAFAPVYVLFSLMIVLLASVVGNAQSVFVNEVQGEDLDKGTLRSVFELVRSSVVQEKGYSLAADGKSAQLLLQPKLLKLGDSYFLSIDKLRGNSVVFSSRMKSANLDDMDTVALRVVRAVLRETQAAETASVRDVTKNEETQNTRRIQATRQWRLGFGPGWGQNLESKKAGTAFELGYVWGMEAAWDLYLNWTIYSGRGSDDNSRYSAFALGANYFFTESKHAPFVTASFGYGGATVNDKDSSIFDEDSASGWAVGAGGGIKFFRTSTVNVGLSLNHSVTIDKTKKSDKTPGLSTLILAVYY